MGLNSEVSLTENTSDLYFYAMCMCGCVSFKGRHLDWMRGVLSQYPGHKWNLRTVFRASNEMRHINESSQKP